MKSNLNKLILILIFIIWGLFFFFQDNEESKVITEKNVVKEEVIEADIIQKEHKKEIKIAQKEKIIIKPIVKKELKEEAIQEFQEEIKKKKNVLYQTSSVSHMHTIKVISNIEITNLPTDRLDYVSLEGNVVNPNGVDGRFSMSLRENYLEYLDNIYIEVSDKISKTTSNCDASFLVGIDKNGFYKFNFDSSSCYITEYRPESVFFKRVRASIKPVELSEEQFKSLPKETQEKILKRIEEIKKTKTQEIN